MISLHTATGLRRAARTLGLLLCLLGLALPATVRAQAQEASIKRELEARFPGMKIDRVMKAGFLGLYEVQMGQEIVYTDERASYLINGEVIDARSRRNLTQDRIDKLSEVRFDSLPLELAIKQSVPLEVSQESAGLMRCEWMYSKSRTPSINPLPGSSDGQGADDPGAKPASAKPNPKKPVKKSASPT